MRKLLFPLLLVSFLVPSAASAGVYLGGRLGAGIPGGEIEKDAKLGDFVSWTVPVQLEAGFGGERFSVGGYLRIAPGKLDSSIADSCDAAGASCSVFDLAIGAQAELRFSPGNVGPWLGGFVGYEILRYDYALGGLEAAVSAKGWELGAQGGFDLAWGVLRMGPYGSIGIGQFTSAEIEIGGASSSGDITDKAIHTWIQLGIRGAFAF